MAQKTFKHYDPVRKLWVNFKSRKLLDKFLAKLNQHEADQMEQIKNKYLPMRYIGSE